MSFKEKLINHFTEKYHENIRLQRVFEGITDRLYTLERELENFTRYGLRVDLDVNGYSAKLSIENYILRVDLFHDDDPPFIQVVGGTKEFDRLIDKIYPSRHLLTSDICSADDFERAFDSYLQNAFSGLVR